MDSQAAFAEDIVSCILVNRIVEVSHDSSHEPVVNNAVGIGHLKRGSVLKASDVFHGVKHYTTTRPDIFTKISDVFASVLTRAGLKTNDAPD